MEVETIVTILLAFINIHAFTFIEIFISPYAEVEVMAFPPAYVCVCVLVAQLCPTLCDSMDCSYSVHGIYQARILEWIAIPFSRASSSPRDQIWISHITAI